MLDPFQNTSFQTIEEDTVENPRSADSGLRQRQEVPPTFSDCKPDPEASEKAVLPLWTPMFFRIARKNMGLLPLSPTPDVSGLSAGRKGVESQQGNTHMEICLEGYAQT